MDLGLLKMYLRDKETEADREAKQIKSGGDKGNERLKSDRMKE